MQYSRYFDFFRLSFQPHSLPSDSQGPTELTEQFGVRNISELNHQLLLHNMIYVVIRHTRHDLMQNFPPLERGGSRTAQSAT